MAKKFKKKSFKMKEGSKAEEKGESAAFERQEKKNGTEK